MKDDLVLLTKGLIPSTGLNIKDYFLSPRMGGKQLLVRFNNGYGASIVQFRGSYGYTNRLYELAVIKFNGSVIQDFCITYDTPITDDVLGYLTEEGVIIYLKQISELGESDLEARRRQA